MPHITTYTGLIARNQASQPTDDFIKLGDIKGEFQVTEFSGDVVTGQANSDDSLAYAGSLFGEGVFKPQSIEDKGSVIFGDNHFRTGGGDSLTGEGRSTKIWTTGGPSTFEDRQVGDYDANDAVFGMNDLAAVGRGPFIPGGNERWNCTCVPDFSLTETFEPVAVMDFAGFTNGTSLEGSYLSTVDVVNRFTDSAMPGGANI